MEKIKIVYITGYGRSGGTLIGRLLGDTKNAFFIGELRNFWKYGILKNHDCSCGQKFDMCDFWKQVADEYIKLFRTYKLQPRQLSPSGKMVWGSGCVILSIAGEPMLNGRRYVGGVLEEPSAAAPAPMPYMMQNPQQSNRAWTWV